MWNVVHMGNGNNYLVDVTNCDEGSTGADDKLFLTGYTTGSVDEGYTIKIPSENPEMAPTVTYQYDKDEYTDIAAIYGIENITLVQGGILKESDLSTGEACEHNYEAVFNWADDHKSCTVTLTCQKDKTHVVPGLVCNVTSTVKTPATCAAKGITSYTAKAVYAGKTYERWHDLRSTYCTLLLKKDFSPEAVSRLMGHARELITIDVYGDNTNIIPEEVPELTSYMEEVMPKKAAQGFDSETNGEEVFDTLIDMEGFLPEKVMESDV